MAQNTELFDDLVEKAKVVEETLPKLACSIVAESSKRASNGAFRRLPNRGRDNYVSCRGARPSQVESRGPAQVYAVREPEDQDPTNVIIGTFTLQSIPLLSLVDSGSTHSYILSELACKLGIPVKTINLGMIVTSSLGDSVVANKVYRRCPLRIQGHIFSVDLMELPFYGFDDILGMDWLIEHKAKVDFKTKQITLINSDGLEIVVVGERLGFISNMVSAMKAEKLMGKGCEAYLAYVMNSVSKELRVQDIRTVRDFPNVFPEEFYGLPPERKMEFGIELYPSITQVRVASYYMTPKMFKELKI
ncbi:uncharacterized protein LOC108465080 [Gossypium arboreum]|uniref:uncharacterized protein LOC108465080 n=1 Tax=Gossypium arboreum TaxID=29729 RepID=UPI0008191A57|nr:uncharacterized protein LOC108465080 [Gossypium arboreum]